MPPATQVWHNIGHAFLLLDAPNTNPAGQAPSSDQEDVC